MPTLVKHQYLKPGSDGKAASELHVNYLIERPGRETEGRVFFDSESNNRPLAAVLEAIQRQNSKWVVMHQIILSPGATGVDLKAFTREALNALSSHKKQALEWYAVEHHHSDHEHVHVVVMGTNLHGRSVIIRGGDHAVMRYAGDLHLLRNGFIKEIVEVERSRETHRRQYERTYDYNWQDDYFEPVAEKFQKFTGKQLPVNLEREQRLSEHPANKESGAAHEWWEAFMRKDQVRIKRELNRAIIKNTKYSRVERDFIEVLLEER